MSLPNPGMDAVPFTTLPASFLDSMIANIESLATGTGLNSSAVTNAKILNGTIDIGAKTAPWDGYQVASGTWTYVSATTFTVPSADAAAMAVGTKIKLTQTTVKYFYVVGVSGTTVTITGGTSYTLANAAITSPYFSNAASPVGHPIWFGYVGAIKPNGGTAPTHSTDVGKFKMDGKSVTTQFYKYNSSGGTGGLGTQDLLYTLPVNADTTLTAGGTVPCGIANLYNTSGSAICTVHVNSATDIIFKNTGTGNIQLGDQSAATRLLYASFVYQAA